MLVRRITKAIKLSLRDSRGSRRGTRGGVRIETPRSLITTTYVCKRTIILIHWSLHQSAVHAALAL